MQMPYDRRDFNAILEYLKIKAEQLSNGMWTDFSNGDIGTVMLKLIAYIADMNNYQMDKGLSELYIDTALERESIMSIVKLIGYEPKWYSSATVEIKVGVLPGELVEDKTPIKAYTRWTNQTKTVAFYNVNEYNWINNSCILRLYQGEYVGVVFHPDNVDSNNRIYLDENKVDKETMTITIADDILNRVDNVLIDTSNQLCYSVHVDSQSRVYIQLPVYWSDFITNGTPITVEYLVTDGSEGNIGAHVITRAASTLNAGVSDSKITVDNNLPSEGGADPDTIEEIQVAAPLYASTMNTLVTLGDLELVKHEVEGISDIVALDYNSPESGLLQPADAYKVNLYVLPKDKDYIVEPDDTLTDLGKELKDYIDSRRLTSIIINYKNVEILTPDIKVVAYINKYDLRAAELQNEITNLILRTYSKENMTIGQGIYSSKLSKQILDEIDYCNYIEIQLPDDSYVPGKMQFLKVQKENIEVVVVEE